MAQNRPLPRICIALGIPDLERLLEQARREAEAGESFLEFRLDYLEDPEQGARAIRAFVDQYPDCIVLATCRRHQNHGKFNGSIEDEIRVLDLAVSAGAQAVDVEIESAEMAAAKLGVFRGRARLIVSYHNYETTPQLETLLSRMMRIPADAYKVVTTARKPSDYGRVLGLPRAHPRTQMVILTMGELGFPSRVLSAVFGGIYTYAAPMATQGTAAGQVCARQLRHLYRIEKLSRSSRIYGVIADPVRHSISPAVHNRAFQYRRIEAVYLPFLVAPAHVRDFFGLAEKLPIAGFSVTIPHKQKILRYLDIVDPLARRIGAVNTVWRKSGKWRGANTDVAGVTVPLGQELRLRNASILIAGNGGAARGAACALADAGAHIALVGRNPDRVRSLAKICGAEALTIEQLEQRSFDALVHATPVGMFPHVNECFFNGRIPAGIVLDMVYNPLETELTRRARQQGKTVIPGVQMFIEQAVRQFEIWTGETAPRSLMEKTALEALSCTT
jgi:3-dehydroquinate dehydratase/shikimate dehydrogenase